MMKMYEIIYSNQDNTFTTSTKVIAVPDTFSEDGVECIVESEEGCKIGETNRYGGILLKPKLIRTAPYFVIYNGV